MTNMTASALVQPATRPQGEVNDQTDRMAKACEGLRMVIGDLEDRLISVLAERKEESGTPTSQPEPVRVPLAQCLHAANLGLGECENRLRSIINRIEL